MNHLDDGTLQSLVDGELGGDESRAIESHLDDCPACAERLGSHRARSLLVRGALALVDPPVSLDAARQAVLHRVSPSRRPAYRIPWARAAALVLLFGGAAAAAVPGSPVRGWIERSFGDAASEPAALDVGAAAIAAEEAVPGEAGIRIAPADGRVEIQVTGAVSGGEVVVSLVEGPQAAVFAGDEASFRSRSGTVEVSRAGATVRVELPRGVADARLEVNGIVYVRSLRGRLETPGPGADRDGDRITFRIPEGGDR